MSLDQKTMNGLQLFGMAMTAGGLIPVTVGWGKLYLIIAAVLLGILGFMELFSRKKK
jgi:hypothetical protein